MTPPSDSERLKIIFSTGNGICDDLVMPFTEGMTAAAMLHHAQKLAGKRGEPLAAVNIWFGCPSYVVTKNEVELFGSA